jgi:hypothetical protein
MVWSYPQILQAMIMWEQGACMIWGTLQLYSTLSRSTQKFRPPCRSPLMFVPPFPRTLKTCRWGQYGSVVCCLANSSASFKCSCPAFPNRPSLARFLYARSHLLIKYSLHFWKENSTIPDTGNDRTSVNTRLKDSDELVVMMSYLKPTSSYANAHKAFYSICSSNHALPTWFNILSSSLIVSLKWCSVRTQHRAFTLSQTSFFL